MSKPQVYPSERFRSLGFTVLISLLVFSFITTVLFSLISLFTSYNNSVSRIQAAMEEVSDTQISPLAASLWAFDEQMTLTQLAGICRLPSIHYAAIIENEKILLFSGTAPQEARSVLVRDFPLLYDQVAGDRHIKLGVLRLESNLDILIPELLARFSETLLWQGLEKGFIALFSFLLFNALVSRHLTRVTAFFEGMDATSLHVKLDLQRPSRRIHDEFDLVAERVNQMRENLLESFLAQKAAEKTLQENEKIIRRQVVELEDKNAELERFTYTVSHDLKSPLITIQGFAGYLAKDLAEGKTDMVHRDLEKISNAINKMQHLLADLLEVSRVGRLVNLPTFFSMLIPVKEAIDLLEGSISNAGVTVHLPTSLPQVNADKLRIREVWQNLMENAIKYRRPEIPLVLEIGYEVRAGVNVFFIKDNGIGIRREFLDKIFGLFEKLNAYSEGTGIGLALVRRIVEFHGGKVWAESDGEKGSAFYFTLGELLFDQP